VYGVLKDKELRTIAPEEAADLIKTGDWVLLDVRRPDQHEGAHPEGCVSVPMYRLIDMSKPDFAKVMKVIAYSFNGVQAIESNSDFTKEALAAAGGRKIITMCEAGGTMKPSVNFPFGKPSRSLQAAYKILAEGGVNAGDVAHLERGLYGWYQAELPITGDYKPDLGRTPMAAADPTLQNVAQSTGYEMKEGDKALQQEEKKKGWFGF
jgi:rhodanese-related sulfurtransferase